MTGFPYRSRLDRKHPWYVLLSSVLALGLVLTGLSVLISTTVAQSQGGNVECSALGYDNGVKRDYNGSFGAGSWPAGVTADVTDDT